MRRAVASLTGDFRLSVWRTLLAVAARRRILVGRGFRVRGLRRISTDDGWLRLGRSFYGFVPPGQPGVMRVRGVLRVGRGVSIAPGGMWDIGPQGHAEIGEGTYFGPFTKVIVMTRLRIGAGCAVAWDCQFLDNDFHALVPRRAGSPAIQLGDRVWLGSGVSILRGTTIGDGCVVAAGSVVRGDFSEPNCLIGGVPARVLRRGIAWE